MNVAGHVALRFTDDAGSGIPVNLTAVRAQGTHLWVAGDETPILGRLVLDSTVAPTRAGRQRGFRLADLVQLPGPANGEADLKGIACTEHWLWAIGSHALVRRRPKPEHDDPRVVRRLGKLRRDPNRYVIARLAVQLGVDRHPEPVRVARDGRRSALIGAPGAENLVDLLRSDAHLAPFLAIPGQDNGFEVQGLAAVGDRLYVGLRGPVLRGWGVVLEVRPAQDPTDPGRLALGILPEGARYRKHFLDLDGLGVRGLCQDGDDLLVLAGPAMAVSGPVRVHRWLGAAAGSAGPVVRSADLPVEAVVPHGEGDDHPAGMTLLTPDPQDARPQLLVIYDAPATTRHPWADTVFADRVRIGREPGAAAPEPAAPGGAGRGTVTQGPAAQAPAAQAPAAQAPAAQAPVTRFPISQYPVSRYPTTPAPVTQAPVTQAPVTPSPVTPSRVTQAPVAPSPVTQAPVAPSPVARGPVARGPVAQEPVVPSPFAGGPALADDAVSDDAVSDDVVSDDVVPDRAAVDAPDPNTAALDAQADADEPAPGADDDRAEADGPGEVSPTDADEPAAAADPPAAATDPADPAAADPPHAVDDLDAEERAAAVRRFRADGHLAEHLLHSSAAIRSYGHRP